MISTFTGNTANEVWSMAARHLLNNNQVSVDSRNGNVNEILHAIISISNPLERWVTNRIPPISLAFSLAELIWILNGSNDAKIINCWNPALPRYSGNTSEYPGAYGFRIRFNYGFDQLERAYYALKCNPNSRQIVITIWDPRLDFPNENGETANMDVPCNICSMLKIRNGKLEWTQIMRSNDIYRGLPYNIVQFTSLQEILAGWLDAGIGTYTHYSDSLHLYSQDRRTMHISKDIREVNLDYENYDSLALPKEKSKEVVDGIYNRMVEIANSKPLPTRLFDLSQLDSGYQSYNNIMFILAAYVAHREGQIDLEKDLVSRCTNKLFCYMWGKWSSDKKNSM